MRGPVKTTRYEEIEVEYLNANFKPKKDKFTVFTAQIIQHKPDHVQGFGNEYCQLKLTRIPRQDSRASLEYRLVNGRTAAETDEMRFIK